jgi:hypothetical protein
MVVCHAPAVTYTLWSHDGSKLLTADASGGCGLWRISAGKLELCHKFALGSGAACACYIGVGASFEQRFAVGCDNGRFGVAAQPSPRAKCDQPAASTCWTTRAKRATLFQLVKPCHPNCAPPP